MHPSGASRASSVLLSGTGYGMSCASDSRDSAEQGGDCQQRRTPNQLPSCACVAGLLWFGRGLVHSLTSGEKVIILPGHRPKCIHDRDTASSATRPVADHGQPLDRVAVHPSCRRVAARARRAASRVTLGDRARGEPRLPSGERAGAVAADARVGQTTRDLAGAQMAWERALGWIPTFSCTIGSTVVRGTIFAPYGRDADVAGAVYALSVENRAGEAMDIAVGLEGSSRTARCVCAARVASSRAMSFHEAPTMSLCSRAVRRRERSRSASVPTDRSRSRSANPRPKNSRCLESLGSRRARASTSRFTSPSAPSATAPRQPVRVLRRRGWRELLSSTRDALQSLQQTATNDAMDRLDQSQSAVRVFLLGGTRARRCALLPRANARAVERTRA